MRKCPIIGISCRAKAEESEKSYSLIAVRQSYIESVIRAGGNPILLPLGLDKARLRALFELCDGILLPGGEDVNPALYGESPHPKLGSIAPERDSLEIELARWCVAEHKPLLGICRGLQLLNVALGGSLFQDLPSQKPSTIEHDIYSSDQWEHTAHTIDISKDSRLYELLKCESIGVNSLHHQAINRIAPELKISAASPDGIIEGVEGSADTFLLALQCHPETLWQKVEPRWLRVFEALVAAAAK